MKFLTIGDLQIDCDDANSQRSIQTRNTLGWLVDLIDNVKPDVVVHLGDYGENNNGVDHYSLMLMTWFISEVQRMVPCSFWLAGNHDFKTESGDVNLMQSLRYLMNENHQVAFPWCSGPENTFFCSYLAKDSSEKFRAEMGLLFEERSQQVLFSHLPVRGAMFAPGRYDEDGMDPNWFPGFTVVGHYHKPNPPSFQQIASGHAILYAGAPMSHDFRDNCYGLETHQQLRGVWLLDIQQGVVTESPQFFENPCAHYFLSFSADVEYDGQHNSGMVHDDWFNTKCVIPLDRTTVRITVPADKEDQAAQIFSQTSEASMVLRDDRHEHKTTNLSAIDPDANSIQAVEEYVDAMSGNLGGLDPVTLKLVGKQLVTGSYQLPEVQQ